MRLAISGLTAAGKTTHAKLLCRYFNLQYVSASQLLLRLAGYNLSQDEIRNFWVSEEGLLLSRRMPEYDIDGRMREMSAHLDDVVFDAPSLPWLSDTTFNIWIESDLNSRLWKAIVSHGETSTLSVQEVKEKIIEKDNVLRETNLRLYSFDIFENRSPFHLIFDISAFIKAPTVHASKVSISLADEVITHTVGLFAGNDEGFRIRFETLLAKYGEGVFRRVPIR